MSRAQSFRSLCIAFIVLPTVATAVRFWSRGITNKNSFWWDDWICLAALITSICLCAIGYVWTFYGLGQHLDTVAPTDIVFGLKLLYAAYYFFNIGIGLVKFSALFFYVRIFRLYDRKFRIAIWTANILCVGWLIFAIPSITFNCTPVQKFWNKTLPGHCLNTSAWYLASGIFDSLLDLMVLLLPLPMLRKLQMSRSRKILVLAAFVCGYCSLIASLGRLVSIGIIGSELDSDFTWNAVTVLEWSLVEPGIGIISICLPSWFQLAKRAKQSGIGSLFTTISTEDAQYKRSKRDYVRPEDESHTNLPTATQARIDSYEDLQPRTKIYKASGSYSDIPLNEIRVKRDVDVSAEPAVGGTVA